MNDPIFIWSYVIFFSGTLGSALFLVWLDRRNKPEGDHPAPGE
ncbi:MAG TPA: hypothetical protein VIL88_09190 [Devosia sp.]|jgi:hypothetical protein